MIFKAFQNLLDMKNRLILSALLIAVFTTGYSQEKLEVNGAIVLKNSEDPTPADGTVRFNSTTNDFEGWNGQWVSLTGSSGPTGSGMVTDIDGNQYLTVTIGSQTWMRENLRTTRYRNGDPIPEVLLNSDWAALASGAWSWYANDPEKDMPYGKLYNWYAVKDGNGLCPTGWHEPTDAEWTILTTYLGDLSVAGGKMKITGTIEAGTGYWSEPNTGATNESGFTGLPGGNRSGAFDNRGNGGLWWSSTESGANAWYRALIYDGGHVIRSHVDKTYGFSVRCLRD